MLDDKHIKLRIMDEFELNEALAKGFDTRAPEQFDLSVVATLQFLEQDILDHPENLTPLSHERVEILKRLTEGVEFDIDEPLDPEDQNWL